MNDYLSYTVAKEFVKKLRLSSYHDWINYIHGKILNLPTLPVNIPTNPDKVYKSNGWLNWEDWFEPCEELITPPQKTINQNKILKDKNIKYSVDEYTTLESLKIQFQLSVRAYNVCLFNEIKTLKDLIQYHSINNGFKNLRNCGVKTATELKYILNNIDSIEILEKDDQVKEDLSLNEIIHQTDVSRRAYNCCLMNGLTTRRSLVDYLAKYGSFLNIRNCGANTNTELIKFLKKSENRKNSNISYIKTVLPTIQNNFLFLSREYFDILKRKFTITEKTNQLLNKNSIDNVYKFFMIFVDGTSYHLRKKNKKLFQPEIIHFAEYIVKYVWLKDPELYAGFTESTKQDSITFSSYLLKNKIVDTESLFELNIQNAFHESTFDILKLIHFHTLTYNKRDYEILKYRVFGNVEYCTLAELGVRLNITRERVRQIATGQEKKIFMRIKRLLANNKFILSYMVQQLKLLDFNLISSNNIEEIRLMSNVNFSNQFILQILKLLNQRTHVIELFKDDVWIAISNRSGFNLSQFKYKLNEMIDNASHSLIRFNFENFISQFIARTDLLKFQELSNFLKVLLADHYEIYVIDNQIDLSSLKRRLKHQDIEDVLKDINRPMKVDEIEECLKKKFDSLAISKTNLLRLIREDTNIIHVGRSSTFGLLAWEQDRLFMGGTIRNIVYNFLKDKDKPIHISEVENHVNLYRKTNRKSILYNLKLEKHKRFLFLENGFIQILK